MHPARPNRTRRVVAGLATTGVLLLAGCSNDAAPDAPAPAPSSAPASASALVSGSGSGSAVASTGSRSAVASSGVGSGSAVASTGSGTAGTSGSVGSSSSSGRAAGTGSTTSVSPSSRSSKPTPSSPKPSGSAAVDDFDAATAAWFDGLCSGLENKPRDEFDGLTGDVDAKKTAAAALFTAQANTITASVAAMKKAGTPDIPGGEKFDTAVLQTYPKMAAAARDAATAIAGVTSEDELEEAFSAGRDAVTEAAAPLGAYGEIIGAPAVTVQMAKIPSCRAIVPN